jgi:serine/threonine protein kinase
MELCGPILRQWLVLDDTSGLAHLHDNLHIHRDLKPGNIYFSSNSNSFQALIVKICDLGFTREMSGNMVLKLERSRKELKYIELQKLILVNMEHR